MSADNIAVCPRCNEVNAGTQNPYNTLREYYGIGLRLNGKFIIEYSCICHECDYSFEYKYEAQPYIPNTVFGEVE
jgi:hypothetical protein